MVEKFAVPVLVINFKVYRESMGSNAIKLARAAEKVAKETDACIVVCPPFTDLAKIAESVDVHVWGQGADAVEPGGQTAHVPVEALKEAGATGLLINHSEKRLKLADMEFIAAKARTNGLKSCICTNNVATSASCAALAPEFIAVEPPELIGGDISVTTSDPAIVSNTVQAVRKVDKNVLVLCGAGVKNGKDVAKALELGSNGVLVASGVIKAKDQEAAIADLVGGF